MFFRKYRWWFPVHIILNVVAVIGSFVGMLTGFSMAEGYFTIAHHYLGFFTVLFSFAQPVLGWLAHRHYNPKRTEIPVSNMISY
jgi:hypothetical protein